MLALISTLIALTILGSSQDGEVNIGFTAPLLVDLMGWYVVGAYIGVFPAIA